MNAVPFKDVVIDIRYEPEDGIFIAEVREMQGCWASAPTKDLLVANLNSAINDYLEIFQ